MTIMEMVRLILQPPILLPGLINRGMHAMRTGIQVILNSSSVYLNGKGVIDFDSDDMLWQTDRCEEYVQ